jgi:TolA-binding protein
MIELRRATAALLAFLLLTVSPGAARAAEATPDRLFELSMKLLEAKSYASARDGFASYRQAVGDAEPNAPRYVDSIYYEAEARYLDGDKFGAHELYRKILDFHRNFPHVADVIKREYEIGSAFIEGKAKKPFLFFNHTSESTGAEILEYVIERYQQRYFDYAQYQVADYYFRDHDWRRAADAFLALEENFKESPWAGVAQYQRALCYKHLSRGYRYDPSPVTKAEEVLLDYVKKNPTGSRIREAEKALEEIREGRCKLYAENVEFYLWRERRPRAALVYAEAILRDTPDAPGARDVPAMLEKIADKAGDDDPATAAKARDLLAELEKRRPAPASPQITPPTPATLVPGVKPTSGTK